MIATQLSIQSTAAILAKVKEATQITGEPAAKLEAAIHAIVCQFEESATEQHRTQVENVHAELNKIHADSQAQAAKMADIVQTKQDEIEGLKHTLSCTERERDTHQKNALNAQARYNSVVSGENPQTA